MPPCHTNPLLPTDLTHRTPPPHQKQAICPRTTGTTGKHTKKTRTQTRGRCRDKSPLPFCCTLGLIFFSVTCIAGVLASWADGASGRACHALKSQEDLAGSRVMYLLLCFLASNWEIWSLITGRNWIFGLIFIHIFWNMCNEMGVKRCSSLLRWICSKNGRAYQEMTLHITSNTLLQLIWLQGLRWEELNMFKPH